MSAKTQGFSLVRFGNRFVYTLGENKTGARRLGAKILGCLRQDVDSVAKVKQLPDHYKLAQVYKYIKG